MIVANMAGQDGQECLSGTTPWVIQGDARQGVRERLEDTWTAATIAGQEGERSVLVACDGVGGVEGGRLASRAACSMLIASLLTGDSSIPDAFAAAQEVVAELDGPATTAVVAIIEGDEVAFAWVGDSRGWILDAVGGTARQVTRDHSGISTDAWGDRREVITQWLGKGGNAEPEIAIEQLGSDGGVALTTDGVHGVIRPDELASALGPGNPDATHDLVELALLSGSSDNCTCVLACRAGGERAHPTCHLGGTPTCVLPIASIR